MDIVIEDIKDGKALVRKMLKEKLVSMQKTLETLQQREQKAKDELSYLPNSIEKTKASINVVQIELKRTNSFICEYCGGRGKVTVQYDQDDIKTEDCDVCKGNGYLEGKEMPRPCSCKANNWVPMADKGELNTISKEFYKCTNCNNYTIFP